MTSDSTTMYNNCKEQTGFTLLELMVALAILAVIFSIIFKAYTDTYRNIDIAENQARIYDMARTAMIRIMEDLESTYIPIDFSNPQGSSSTDLLVGKKDFLDGREADRIRFFSRSHIDINESLTEGGNAKIAYYPLLKEDETISLFRSDTPSNLEWPEENTNGWIICEGLHSISFTYTDKDGDTHEEWDESNTNYSTKLPSIINIKLEFIDKEDPETPITFISAVAIPMAN